LAKPMPMAHAWIEEDVPLLAREKKVKFPKY
jgi:hypothetical protein